MTKVLTAEMQQKHAERQLFTARQALAHLVKLYETGQWRHLYKEEAFAEAVRQARQAVDTWTNAAARAEAEVKAKSHAI
jgi:uncharacterized repeat protein (TIGR03809 family)